MVTILKKYSLTATFKERSTTLPIFARNGSMARYMAFGEINKRKASDERFEKGEIVVLSPEKNEIMKIEEE